MSAKYLRFTESNGFQYTHKYWLINQYVFIYIAETETKQKRASNNSLDEITRITAGSSNKNIVYGIGPIWKLPFRLLIFDIEANYDVNEYLLVSKVKKKNENIHRWSCGLTAGPCFHSNGHCIFICIGFRQAKLLTNEMVYFEEPKLNHYLQKIEFHFLKLWR